MPWPCLGTKPGLTESLLPRRQMVLEYEGLLWLPLWWTTSSSGAVCFLSVKHPLFLYCCIIIGSYINMNCRNLDKQNQNLMYHLNSAYFRHCYDFWFTPEKDMFLRKQIYKMSKLGSVFLVDSLQTISLIPCNNVVKIVLNSQKCCFFGPIT